MAGRGFQHFNQFLKFRRKKVLLALPNWYTFLYQALLGVFQVIAVIKNDIRAVLILSALSVTSGLYQ